ncbi:hypothetical protein GR160_00890 [Flavobacterium sp. Sd200]|uniref:hypothetical protein n=1 Tax=Flavobacterium sp. Sd200 TaxID=2692211 RepID=UPI0013711C8F|nr:hypothetical protein [Flavobacterium sp. Sd200]MXN89771.1 hypothetical protein [Flavobacterium sp. Sd200]
MKKIILFLVLTLSTISFAQLKKVEASAESNIITIGKAQQLGAPLEASCDKKGNTYFFTIKNSAYKTLTEYKTFSFEDVDNTFEDLYKTIEEGFNTMPKEAVKLELPDHYLWLKFDKFFGGAVLTITFSEDKTASTQLISSNQIAKKQIEKLFGKRK